MTMLIITLQLNLPYYIDIHTERRESTPSTLRQYRHSGWYGNRKDHSANGMVKKGRGWNGEM